MIEKWQVPEVAEVDQSQPDGDYEDTSRGKVGSLLWSSRCQIGTSGVACLKSIMNRVPVLVKQADHTDAELKEVGAKDSDSHMRVAWEPF